MGLSFAKLIPLILTLQDFILNIKIHTFATGQLIYQSFREVTAQFSGKCMKKATVKTKQKASLISALPGTSTSSHREDLFLP